MLQKIKQKLLIKNIILSLVSLHSNPYLKINETFQTLSSPYLKDPSFQWTFSTPSNWNIFLIIKHLSLTIQDYSTFWTSSLYQPLTIVHECDIIYAQRLIKVTKTALESLRKVCYSPHAWRMPNIYTKNL